MDVENVNRWTAVQGRRLWDFSQWGRWGKRRCLQPRIQRAAMHQQTDRVAVPYIKGTSGAATSYLSGHGTADAREKLHVIYGLECSQCSVEYVGETGKRLRTRMRAQTAENWHTFDVENVRVIHRDQKKGGRLLRVALHTRSKSNNSCIELHLVFQILQHRLQYRGRPYRGYSSTKIRREERTTADIDQTPQEQQLTTADSEGLRRDTNDGGSPGDNGSPATDVSTTRTGEDDKSNNNNSTKTNPIIELGDQTGDDCTILNKANQKTANNLTYHGIMWSMVS